MIVKVQISLWGFPADAPPEVLVYNEDRSVFYKGPLSKETAQLMGNSRKAFFTAEVENGRLKLIGNALWQDW